MSKLNVKLNLSTQQWTIEEVDISSRYVDIFFGFEDIISPIEFSNLSFGIVFQKDNNIVYHTTFPKVGVVYKSTELDFIETFRIESLERDSEYNLTIWANNDGINTETTYVLTTPNEPEFTDYEVV